MANLPGGDRSFRQLQAAERAFRYFAIGKARAAAAERFTRSDARQSHRKGVVRLASRGEFSFLYEGRSVRGP